MTTLESLKLSNLSRDEKWNLIHELWESLSGESFVLTEAKQQELARRLEADELNPDAGRSWDEVKARARAAWQS